MPCETWRASNGGRFTVCSRRRRRRCGEPGCSAWSDLLCDYALTGSSAGKTCDRPLCRRHAHRMHDVTKICGGLRTEDSVDYCPTHFALVRATLEPAANDADAQLSLSEIGRPRPAPSPAPVSAPAPRERPQTSYAQALLLKLEGITP